eukprot:418143_1
MVESRYEESSSSTTRKKLFCEASFSEDGPDEGRGDQKMNKQQPKDSEDEMQFSNFIEIEKNHQEDYTSNRLFCGGNTSPNGGNENEENRTTRGVKEVPAAATALSHPSLVSLEKVETAIQKDIINAPCTSVAALSVPSMNEKKQLIRVFLRLRPLPSSLLSSPEILPSRSLEVLSRTKVRTMQPTGNQTLRSQKHSDAYAKVYNFDGVYDERVNQMETYDSITKDLVQNVANGASCVLFSYGATNSGKTHSIFGANGWGTCQSDANELEGILPRAMRELLQLSGSRGNGAPSTVVFVSLFEIYREKVYDLMVKRDRKTHRLELFNRDKNTWKVAGLHWLNASKIGVTGTMKQLFKSTQRRHRSSNGLNATSSRSHCVCQIELRRESPASSSGMTSEGGGVLRIIDLAGSERASKTTFEGGDFFQRRQEAININKTMLTLWQCLRGMQQRRSLLQPFLAGIRESTLTKWICPYLFDSLPGSTVVLVSVSPASDCYDETQHVLDNASMASKIRIQPSAVMTTDEVQTGESNNYPSQQQQLCQHGKKRWNTSTSVDGGIITSQAYCQQYVKRQRPLTTAEIDEGYMTELHELRSKLSESKAENDLLSKELCEIKANWNEKAAAIQSETMEQHELAIRDEVAEELRVIMGDMASEIKSLKRQVQEPISSCVHAALSAKRENARRLKIYIQDREEQIEECEAEMERMRQAHADEMDLLREELKLTKRRLEESLLLLNNNPKEYKNENPIKGNDVNGSLPLNDGLMTIQKDDVLTPTSSPQVVYADEVPPMQKIMHSEPTLAKAENDCREQSVSENSTGVSHKCSPLAAPATATATETPNLGPDLVGTEVMLQQERNLWKLGKIIGYRPRARKLKYVITFSEGVNADVAEKRESQKIIELREDTYGFEEGDIWHLLTPSCSSQGMTDNAIPPPLPSPPNNTQQSSMKATTSSLLPTTRKEGGERRRCLLAQHQPLAPLGKHGIEKKISKGMNHPRVGLDLDCTPPWEEKTLAGKLMNKEKFRGTVATKFLR